MSESPIIQALQSIYDGAKTVALAELAQYGKEWNVVDIYQTSSTKYLAVPRGLQQPSEFVQINVVASCTVTCMDSMMGNMDVRMELTYNGEWKVKEIRKYAGR